MRPRDTVMGVGFTLALLLSLTLAQPRAQAASFTGLGDLPRGSFFSQAFGVSADG
jgi:hypothetical protein